MTNMQVVVFCTWQFCRLTWHQVQCWW